LSLVISILSLLFGDNNLFHLIFSEFDCSYFLDLANEKNVKIEYLDEIESDKLLSKVVDDNSKKRTSSLDHGFSYYYQNNF
jgi:hypothetical protein